VPNSRVVSVEPQPEVIDLLRQNAGQFGARSIVYPYALSNRDGEAFFDTNPANRGQGHLSNKGVKIETRKADSLFRDTKLTKLDLVKINVEGHEQQVIASCKRIRPPSTAFRHRFISPSLMRLVVL
jgi:FkbM family methyltransferase